MTRRCPCCGLPARDFGRIASASSNDGQTHGLAGICKRCTTAEARLPKATRWKRMDRALARPDEFLCKVYPDPGAARVALSMLQHPEHGRDILAGLGWW
jgi:hypothetical protein